MFCCSALLVSCSYTTQSQNCTCDFSPSPQDRNKPKIIFPPSSLRLPGCSLRRCSSGWQHTGSAILASRLMKLLKELLNKENQGCWIASPTSDPCFVLYLVHTRRTDDPQIRGTEALVHKNLWLWGKKRNGRTAAEKCAGDACLFSALLWLKQSSLPQALLVSCSPCPASATERWEHEEGIEIKMSGKRVCVNNTHTLVCLWIYICTQTALLTHLGFCTLAPVLRHTQSHTCVHKHTRTHTDSSAAWQLPRLLSWKGETGEQWSMLG